ncbi:MAG: hypothetical protein WBB31_12170 [Saprospiraceae bacterium]
MVIGLDKFKEYFEAFPDQYVIIGGTACDVVLTDAGFIARATKDIDIILIIEALNQEFVAQFWIFIQDGDYERREESTDERRYYRFTNPATEGFPKQIELFARKPEIIFLPPDAHLIPIPVDDDLSSLSAILLNDEYYEYIIEHSKVENGLRMANIESLIVLKAKAFLEIRDRIANGQKEDSRHITKHKNDVYRLGVMLTETDSFNLPPLIKSHMMYFMEEASKEIPDARFFKDFGAAGVDPKAVHDQLITSFKLNVNG